MQILEHFKASAELDGGKVSQKPCHHLLPGHVLPEYADLAMVLLLKTPAWPPTIEVISAAHQSLGLSLAVP